MKHSVLLSELAWKKIMYWVNKQDAEISGFGLVEYIPERKVFYITDVFLIEQVVTGGSTDIDEKGYAKLLFETAKRKGECLFWWHSHVKMGVNWSGTDMDTIKKLGGNGWIVASVFNQREEVRSACAYMAQSPLSPTEKELVLHDGIETVIEMPPMEQKLKEHLDAEFNRKVKKYVPPVVNTFQKTGGSEMSTFLQKHLGSSQPTSFANQSADDEDDSDLLIDAMVVRQMCEETRGQLEGELLAEAWHFGLRGYGTELEAEALGLAEPTYRNIIRNNNTVALKNIEDRLIAAENNGTIDKLLELQEADQTTQGDFYDRKNTKQ